MGLWDRLAGLMLHLIDEYDDQALFLWLCIEETGFPLPLPGDLAMLLAGTRVAQGKMNLIWALFLLEAATLLGGSALYWLGARGERRRQRLVRVPPVTARHRLSILLSTPARGHRRLAGARTRTPPVVAL